MNFSPLAEFYLIVFQIRSRFRSNDYLNLITSIVGYTNSLMHFHSNVFLYVLAIIIMDYFVFFLISSFNNQSSTYTLFDSYLMQSFDLVSFIFASERLKEFYIVFVFFLIHSHNFAIFLVHMRNLFFYFLYF